jgi:hypothetical protein
MRFKVLKVGNIKIKFYSIQCRAVWYAGTIISEENTSYIFRVESIPEDGFRNLPYVD